MIARRSQSSLFEEPGSRRPWLWLALILLAALPPLLVGLGERDATHTMERVAIASSQETWFRQHGAHGMPREENAWMMPSLFGQPRAVKPPLVVWLHMLAWTGADPDTVTADELILRGRVLAVVMGLVLVAATYWAGMSLGGWAVAILAALAVMSTWYFQRQARTASYDIHMAAWVSLAVASGLWAIRPFASPPASARRVVGWTLAGLAMAAAVFSKSPPLAGALVVAPLLLVILLAGSDRRVNLTGLVWAVLLAAVLVGPWFAYARTHVPELGQVILTEARAERDEFQPPWYYLGLLALVAPWTLWLVAGLLFPFLRSSDRGVEAGAPPRRQLLGPWLWFVLMFVGFSIPGAKQQRYILPILPAFGIMVAQLWDHHQRLAERGEVDPGVNLLRVPHWVALLVVSIAMGPLLLAQDAIVAAEWLSIDELPIGPIGPELAVPGSVVLVGLAVAGAWWHFTEPWKPMRAAVVTAAWGVVAATLLWWPYAHADSGEHAIRPEAERVAHIVGDSAVYFLDDDPQRDVRVDVAFLVYAQRVVPGVTALDQATPRGDGKTFLAAPRDARRRELEATNWIAVAELEEMLNGPTTLWLRWR